METLPWRHYHGDITMETLPQRLYYRNFTMKTLPQRLYHGDFTTEKSGFYTLLSANYLIGTGGEYSLLLLTIGCPSDHCSSV